MIQILCIFVSDNMYDTRFLAPEGRAGVDLAVDLFAEPQELMCTPIRSDGVVRVCSMSASLLRLVESE